MKKLTLKKTLLAGVVAIELFTRVTAEEWQSIIIEKSTDWADAWADETITLEKGDRLDVVQFIATPSTDWFKIKIWVNPDKGPSQQNIKIGNNIINSDLMTIYGPCNLKFGGYYYGDIISITTKLTRAGESSTRASRYALVLPEGESGKQKLVLESSTDLVNWTEDSLGSKDSSDKKRFYRLRAVKE
jgi:hypothetical protein